MVEVRAHDAKGELTLHVLEERVAAEAAAEGFLARDEDRGFEKRADWRAGNSKSARVTDPLRRLDPRKRRKSIGQRITNKRDVITRERPTRACALGDKPQSIQAYFDGGDTTPAHFTLKYSAG